MTKKPILPKPDSIDLEKLFDRRVHWHQRWEIFQGVFTPGRHLVKELFDYVKFPDDLSGKTVLDIGAWNGCFSAECVRRGANRVVGLSPEHPDKAGFNRIKEALGYDNMEYVNASAYDMDPEKIGQFDIVLFFGVLYHLRYPLLALDKIYDVCREQLYVESFIMDPYVLLGPDRRPAELGQINPELTDTPLWQFYPGDELGEDHTNWFGPNMAALKTALYSAGFEATHIATWGHRAALATTKAVRPFLRDNTYDRDPIIARSVGLRHEGRA